MISAVFHYLGPSFAVLLFAHIEPLGVAWLRIFSAAIVLTIWRRPWRLLRNARASQWRLYLGMGAVLAVMNSLFYLAVARLPLSTVGAIEFLGTVVLAAVGTKSLRNWAALGLAIAGVVLLTEIRIVDSPLGVVFAFANCAAFVAYVLLGHRIANPPRPSADATDATATPTAAGIDVLAVSMLIGAVMVAPLAGFATPAFVHPAWLMWAVGVGVCSSVIPYVTDQLAMARLPRATFALMLALLPAVATLVGLLVLRQIPSALDIIGIALVTAGVILHRDMKPADARTKEQELKTSEEQWTTSD
ncbi:DMT family transporter [Leifsonia sp. NPDC058292]|uniref:EamA family transporter n=1 Tax=Leifsonia sp. NPDC058292 TaxID=3346428 RepID=UPI0036DB7EFF